MYSKETKNLKLPQWTPCDHPDFLTDMNDAMNKIDDGYGQAAHDHQELKEKVEALSVDFVAVKEQVEELKEKVDRLSELEDNPVFIELSNKVTALESTVDGIIQTDNRQDADLQNLTNQIETIKSDIETLVARVDNHDAEFTIHDREIRELKQEVIHLQNDVDDLRKHVIEFETKVATMEVKVGHIEGEQITQNDRITQVEQSVADQNDKVNSAVESATSALEKATDAEITANAAKELAEKASADVEGVSSSLSTLETRVATNEESLLDHEKDIEQLTKDLQSANTQNEERYHELDDKIGENSTKLVTLGNRTTAIEESSATIQTTVDSLENRIENIEGGGVPGQGEVTKEQFDELSGRVTANETLDIEQGNSIQANQEEISRLDSELSAAKESILQVQGEVNSTVEKVDDIEAQVVTASTLELIFTNESPNVAFDSKTIEINVKDYEFFIVYYSQTANSVEFYNAVLTSDAARLIRVVGESTVYNDVWRDFTVVENGILVGNGHVGNAINDSQIIPISIYGLKKASSTALSDAALARIDTLEEKVNGLPLKREPLSSGMITLTSTEGNTTLWLSIGIVPDSNILLIHPVEYSAKSGNLPAVNTNFSLTSTIEGLLGRKIVPLCPNARFSTEQSLGVSVTVSSGGTTATLNLYGSTNGDLKLVVGGGNSSNFDLRMSPIVVMYKEM